MTKLTKKWQNTGLLDGFTEDECDKLSPILEDSAKRFLARTYDGQVSFSSQKIYDQLKEVIRSQKI